MKRPEKANLQAQKINNRLQLEVGMGLTTNGDKGSFESDGEMYNFVNLLY